MQTYIAILRGINVSGKNTIKMEMLKYICEDIGFKDVKTYIQSGNIVFKSKADKLLHLTEQLTNAIQKKMGLKVPVIILTRSELEGIMQNNPFVQQPNKEHSFIHLTFLAEIPQQENIDKINTVVTSDEYIIKQQVVYLYCPNGYGNTKLNNTFFEKKLNVTATTRNLKTANQLLTMAKQ